MTPSGGAPSARVPRQLPGWRLRALIAAATGLAPPGGPGTFAFSMREGGPRFLDAAEASHLRDVRVVLFGLLLILGTAVAVLVVGFVRARRSAWFWAAVRAGAAIVVAGFTLIGVVLVVAFDAAFTLFHLVFFPGGNWSFDPTRQRMVQLYPTPFWEYAAASLAALSVAAGLAVLWVAGRRGRVGRGAGPAAPLA